MKNKISENTVQKSYTGNYQLNGAAIPVFEKELPEILIITTYPPRECGIATYSSDLIKALENQFGASFKVKICPLESNNEKHHYTADISYVLNTSEPESFKKIAQNINQNTNIKSVLIQHEFGLFKNQEENFLDFLNEILQPVILVFHTVLPHPKSLLKLQVQQMAEASASIIVMTKSSAQILTYDYEIPQEKITIIAHGTHLVPHLNTEELKNKYGLVGKKVLSTFGLLSSGKSIETTLLALPEVIKNNPDILFLVIGKTHPSVVKQDGEKYRNYLEALVVENQLQEHVIFINQFLPLPTLLEYLQLSDIYLFTSKDPNQAVSGTFSYAISCGCPVISTPIPHAREVFRNDAGIIIDFENSHQLTLAINSLLHNEEQRKNICLNALHRMAPTAWENSAIAHALLFEDISRGQIKLQYSVPKTNLDHLKNMTTDFGIIQFSKINQADYSSGYTLDDNARALVAFCKHFELTQDPADIKYITIYTDFISFCLQPSGYFLNYVDENQKFTEQNHIENLEDATGRTIWALGYLIATKEIPENIRTEALITLECALKNVLEIHSTRAMAFVVKGLYFAQLQQKNEAYLTIIIELSNRLVQMYKHETDADWRWFESYLTYGNSVLPEAILCAWLATKNPLYKVVALSTFDFLLENIFTHNSINVISNKGWLFKGEDVSPKAIGGEQPIDVSYTILALSKFYEVFKNEDYINKMEIAFSWFLGNNHLHQIVYNPCTGGCYDGLEEDYVNLNQGAESTISYLMAKLTHDQYFTTPQTPVELLQYQVPNHLL